MVFFLEIKPVPASLKKSHIYLFLPVCLDGIFDLLVRKDNSKHTTFSKQIMQTPHYPQGINEQVSQEKTNWFVTETIINIY